MSRRPARVLEPADVRRLLRHVRGQRYPCRNRLMVLLSFRAGLRACEIAGLDWSMVLTPGGRIGPLIDIPASIAKMGSARRIPMHADIAASFRQLGSERNRSGPVIRSERDRPMTPGSVVNWFAATYAEMSLAGCSSHSGRRTFVTQVARSIARTGGSLRDVQELVGHRSITTTERYIEGDRPAQHRLIRLL